MQLRAASKQEFPKYGDRSPADARFSQSVSHHRDEGLSNNLYSLIGESVAAPANEISKAATGELPVRLSAQPLKALYTPEQRIRRDATKWTLVQGVLAPVQFVVFLVSLALVLRYLATGEGFGVATASVVIKTLLLYAIMDGHLSRAVSRAQARLKGNFPGLSLVVHSADEWGTDDVALDRCKADIARGDIVIATMTRPLR